MKYQTNLGPPANEIEVMASEPGQSPQPLKVLDLMYLPEPGSSPASQPWRLYVVVAVSDSSYYVELIPAPVRSVEPLVPPVTRMAYKEGAGGGNVFIFVPQAKADQD